MSGAVSKLRPGAEAAPEPAPVVKTYEVSSVLPSDAAERDVIMARAALEYENRRHEIAVRGLQARVEDAEAGRYGHVWASCAANPAVWVEGVGCALVEGRPSETKDGIKAAALKFRQGGDAGFAYVMRNPKCLRMTAGMLAALGIFKDSARAEAVYEACGYFDTDAMLKALAPMKGLACVNLRIKSEEPMNGYGNKPLDMLNLNGAGF